MKKTDFISEYQAKDMLADCTELLKLLVSIIKKSKKSIKN
ncbi:Uncharacterized protein dnm_061830 [Desulfonema magnum]|uniref:Four helix bundle protein n=1 Tax=Desulfonema magnum TaxID=45655 RepID=A0A975BRJ4_9BACT|nr:Uncharacterized protein dnm_061830 [Desulfonema magnum]